MASTTDKARSSRAAPHYSKLIELFRERIFATLNAASPIGANECLLMSVVSDETASITARSLRACLDYLETLGLVNIARPGNGLWVATLTHK